MGFIFDDKLPALRWKTQGFAQADPPAVPA